MKNYATIVLTIVISVSLVLSFETVCDEGPCCENGIYLSNQTICRPAANECDLPDYCSGFSSKCTLDISVMEGTPCGVEDDPGECADGVCFNSILKSKVKYCDETCSKVHGNCSQNGTCLCFEPWKNPPYCNTKVSYVMDRNNLTDLYGEMQIIENITAKRFRRSTGHKHKHDKTHQFSESSGDNFRQGPVALPLSVQEEPDQWTKLTQHPVFGPVAVMVVALLILVGIGIWAIIIYRLEKKKQKLKNRVKVRRRSSRKVPQDTSIITDPSVNIDVGK